MTSSVGLLIIGLACLGYASASVYTDALGVKCANTDEECHVLKHCCGELQCFYPRGLDFLKSRKGECKECVEKSEFCQRDKQCCGYEPDAHAGIVCQKRHPVHMNGRCEGLKRARDQCYKDSQCASNDCIKKRFWHMYGKCSDTVEI